MKPFVQPRRIGTRWRIPHETFSAARESIAVISGSGSDNGTTPEGGNAAGSSAPEIQRSTSGRQRGLRRIRGVHFVLQRAQHAPTVAPPAAECLRGEELPLENPSP